MPVPALKGLKLVSAAGAANAINHNGVIAVLSDLAIADETVAGATVNVINNGSITGYITSGDGDFTFNNRSSNSLRLRNFADTDGDGVRDTKRAAISDFGAGLDRFTNAAGGGVYLEPVPGTPQTITTGEYIPTGALSISTAGINHGYMVNLETFDNQGTIDMTLNGQAGDVLVITGSPTAGVAGAGRFISNGGALRLDTVMNAGGLISLSDVLVVDNLSTGPNGPTRLYINARPGSGGVTTGDGIKVVEVLGNNDGSQPFVMGAAVEYGGYEYLLSPGINDPNSWFLINRENRGAAGNIYYSPRGSAYLGNQYMAARIFEHSFVDRRANTAEINDKIWTRLEYNYTKSDLLENSSHEMEANTVVFQLGGSVNLTDDLELGLLGGYGRSDLDINSKYTSATADGALSGVHFGGYANWQPENSNWYLDFWTQYAWLDNKIKSSSFISNSNYDSRVWSTSLEVGYLHELWKQNSGYAWMLEPHAQIIYHDVKVDHFFDSTGTFYADASDKGISTRLGARLYGTHSQEKKGGLELSPFVETNWLYDGLEHQARLNQAALDANLPKSAAELKLGLEGKLSDKANVWTHAGGQWGKNDFQNYELQLGLGFTW